MALISTTLLAFQFDRFSVINELQTANIALMLVTLSTLKCDKSRVVNALQPKHITHISYTINFKM